MNTYIKKLVYLLLITTISISVFARGGGGSHGGGHGGHVGGHAGHYHGGGRGWGGRGGWGYGGWGYGAGFGLGHWVRFRIPIWLWLPISIL